MNLEFASEATDGLYPVPRQDIIRLRRAGGDFDDYVVVESILGWWIVSDLAADYESFKQAFLDLASDVVEISPDFGTCLPALQVVDEVALFDALADQDASAQLLFAAGDNKTQVGFESSRLIRFYADDSGRNTFNVGYDLPDWIDEDRADAVEENLESKLEEFKGDISKLIAVDIDHLVESVPQTATQVSEQREQGNTAFDTSYFESMIAGLRMHINPLLPPNSIVVINPDTLDSIKLVTPFDGEV